MPRIGKREEGGSKKDGSGASAGYVIKYPSPKILLMDMDRDTEATLRSEGYRVSVGSFGKPYRMERSDAFFPVIPNHTLPEDYREQEIVVVDVATCDLLDEPVGEKLTSIGTPDWWASCAQAFIDPRPRAMRAVREDFDRILSAGGCFLAFAAPRVDQDIWIAQKSGRVWQKSSAVHADNWSFLSILSGIGVKRDAGRELSLVDADSYVGHVLREHLAGAQFECTLSPRWSHLQPKWWTFAESKYGDDVCAGIVEAPGASPAGLVLLLPRIADPGRLVCQLLKEALPEISPHLFPYAEGGGRWVHREEYEHADVVALQSEIARIREEADRQIEELRGAIRARAGEKAFLHQLMTATNSTLAAAVEAALKVLGFEQIVNTDEEIEKGLDAGPKREDLQIHEGSPTLLVEIKGISGLPKDEDALQVWKYVAPRMRQWDRTDVQGLSIINHQRHLPALDRENADVFREDVLTNAENQFGLMTTWDLFRLVRGLLTHGWAPEHVKPLFYRTGRIQPVPVHYEAVGTVKRFFEDRGVVGIELQEGTLSCGDRIAFELQVEFVEQDVCSIQVDRQPVHQCEAGSKVGVKTQFSKEQLRPGVRVYRIRDRGVDLTAVESGEES